MDILSGILWLLLAWMLALALQFVRGSKSKATSGKLPPGPIRFPVLGNLLQLGEKPHKSLARLAKIHGPIMSLKLGQATTVVISSATMGTEILQNHDISFCNRTVPDALLAHQHNDFSMIFLPVATLWRNLRKISNSHIFTPQKLDANQDLRRNKVQELLDFVHECCRAGRAVDIGQAAFITNLNLLSNTIFSVNLADLSSDSGREFKELVWAIMVEAGKPNFADFFPLLKKIDPQGIRRRMTIHFGKMLELFDRIIDQRLKLREVNGVVKAKDMLDTLLNVMEDNSEEIDRNNIKHLFLVNTNLFSFLFNCLEAFIFFSFATI